MEPQHGSLAERLLDSLEREGTRLDCELDLGSDSYITDQLNHQWFQLV